MSGNKQKKLKVKNLLSDVTNQSEKLRKRQTIGFEEEEDEDDGK